jgi:hypothetical protein
MLEGGGEIERDKGRIHIHAYERGLIESIERERERE